MWALGQVKPNDKEHFTVAPTLVKLLGSMAHNAWGFAQMWN